ncbi:Desmethyl-deoxy-podophyllotoxin synthase, partial [Linum grandiflorum]
IAPFPPFTSSKRTREKVVLNGFDIPTKIRVIVNTWAINRFTNCSTDCKGTNFHFLPFGVGRRICPGMLFGVATVKLTLASLLFHFDWTLLAKMKPESLDMTETFGISLRRKHPLHLIPIPYINMY